MGSQIRAGPSLHYKTLENVRKLRSWSTSTWFPESGITGRWVVKASVGTLTMSQRIEYISWDVLVDVAEQYGEVGQIRTISWDAVSHGLIL